MGNESAPLPCTSRQEALQPACTVGVGSLVTDIARVLQGRWQGRFSEEQMWAALQARPRGHSVICAAQLAERIGAHARAVLFLLTCRVVQVLRESAGNAAHADVTPPGFLFVHTVDAGEEAESSNARRAWVRPGLAPMWEDALLVSALRLAAGLEGCNPVPL